MWQARPQIRDYFRERTLDIYLLARTPWENVHAFQQRLVFEVSGMPRSRAALILCEHPSIVTVGRQGSYQHIRMDSAAIATGQIPVKWTNRGGGCWHQQPGQLAAYPIVPLCPDRFALVDYRASLYQTMSNVFEEFRIPARHDQTSARLHVGEQTIATVGIAVKDWVAYHGCALNVCVPLDAAPLVGSPPDFRARPTSMFRELRTPVRIDAVRESFLRHFCRVLGFGHYYLNRPPTGALEQTRSANVRIANH